MTKVYGIEVEATDDPQDVWENVYNAMLEDNKLLHKKLDNLIETVERLVEERADDAE